jgi:hypothetical protein
MLGGIEPCSYSMPTFDENGIGCGYKCCLSVIVCTLFFIVYSDGLWRSIIIMAKSSEY